MALIGLLILGAAYRFHAVGTWKQGLSNDESVSYMCAAATAGIWETRISDMVNTPITIGDLQRFYDRPEGFAFRTVSMDMALYDVHPPLYFWVLHFIHVLWGTGPGTGAYVNIVLGLGVLLLVFRVAKGVLPGPIAPLAATVVWYLSPAVVQIDLEARPYQLLTLLALASYLLGSRVVNGQATRATWAGLTLVNTLGLLTHLYFPFILLPGLALVVARYGMRRPSLYFLGSLLVSLAGMVILYPEFLTFLSTYGDRPRDVPEPVYHLYRLKGLLYTTMQFFTEEHAMRYLWLALCLLAVGILGRRYCSSCNRTLYTATIRHPFVLYFGWWAFFTVALFLIGISPAQAVGEQYFAYLWPFVAIGGTRVAGTMADQRIRRSLLGAYLLQLLFAFHSGVRNSPYLVPALPVEWNARIADNDMLITDEAKRTALPRISRSLPASLPLYIMGRKHPDLDGLDRVIFLHLAIKSRPTEPFVAWLATQGFLPEGDVLRSDRYELRSFARHGVR